MEELELELDIPEELVLLSDFGNPIYSIWFYLVPNTIKLAFYYFDYDRMR